MQVIDNIKYPHVTNYVRLSELPPQDDRPRNWAVVGVIIGFCIIAYIGVMLCALNGGL